MQWGKPTATLPYASASKSCAWHAPQLLGVMDEEHCLLRAAAIAFIFFIQNLSVPAIYIAHKHNILIFLFTEMINLLKNKFIILII